MPTGGVGGSSASLARMPEVQSDEELFSDDLTPCARPSLLCVPGTSLMSQRILHLSLIKLPLISMSHGPIESLLINPILSQSCLD